jgi:DNA-binding IclR family transcriptional regulator
MTKAPKGIQSVETGMLVVQVLAKAPGPLSLKAISQAAGMAPSNVHRYLASFIRSGMVYQDPATGQYDLGIMALRLGLSAMSRLDAVALATTALKDLTEWTEQTAMLSVWGELGPTIVRWQRGPQPLVTSLALGSVLPILTSATARVFLAFMPRAMMRRIIEQELEKTNGRRSVHHDLDEMEWRIVESRRTRLARVEGGVIPGLRAASAPVLDFQNEAVAAVTLLGGMSSPAGPFDEAVERMLALTADVSAQLGWAGA